MPAVSAGDVIWKIGTDNSGLEKGMKDASRIVGGFITAASGAILGIAAKSISTYGALGDELAKLASRTGMSIGELSKLRNAADLSDTSLESLGKGMKNVAKVLEDAATGGAQGQEALAKLGFTVNDFIGLNPDQIFDKFARAISEVEDPILRAAYAQEVFGRAGTDMLPMLADGYDAFKKMKDATADVFTEKDGEMAQKYEDNWTDITKALEAAGNVIARALMPSVLALQNKALEWIAIGQQWIRDNGELVATIVKVATVLALIGSVVGPALIAITFMGAGVGALTALFSPLGVMIVAISAALAAGVIMINQYVQSIGGWTVVFDYIKALLEQAKVWLYENWDQIARIFQLAKEIILSAMSILWDGLTAAFYLITAGLQAWVSDLSLAFGQAETNTDGSTKSILDIVQGFAEVMRRIMKQLAYDVGLYVEKIAYYYDWLKTIVGGINTFTGYIPGANPVGAFINAIPRGFATGGTIKQGGWAMVGERGPELVQLPTGSTVYDAQQTRGAQQGQTVTINFGRDSVRSDNDIREIERSLARVLNGGLRAAGAAI